MAPNMAQVRIEDAACHQFTSAAAESEMLAVAQIQPHKFHRIVLPSQKLIQALHLANRDFPGTHA